MLVVLARGEGPSSGWVVMMQGKVMRAHGVASGHHGCRLPHTLRSTNRNKKANDMQSQSTPTSQGSVSESAMVAATPGLE